MLLLHVGIEGESLQGPAAPDPRRDDVLVAGVQFAQAPRVWAPLEGRMTVVGPEAPVIVLDNRVVEVTEDGVGLWIGSVDAHAGIRIGETRLYRVQQGGAEFCFLRFELVKNFHLFF